MAAALFSARRGHEVHIFDHNEKLGKKLFITGKGRCNFTNDCEPEVLMGSVVTNARFLYSSFRGWNSQDTIRLFESLGVRTKVERGNRAFPASDHSSDIIRALEKELKALGVKIHLKSGVKELLLDAADDPEKTRPAVTGLLLDNGSRIPADAVILATGGLSYPATGSTGDGYRMAQAAGHSMQKTRPALVPLETAEAYIPRLQGLALKNVTLTIPLGKKKKFEEFGELLFTHFGISGPIALTASSHIGKALEESPLKAFIDLKPALTREQLSARILREFDQAKNKEFKNVIPSLYPSSLRPVMIELSGISGDRPVRDITKKERERLIDLTKAFPLTITGTRDFREAIITQGGVTVKEVDPSTMASRLVRGLYFAGEILDLDAVTGGFNLQIAWATAKRAADSIE